MKSNTSLGKDDVVKLSEGSGGKEMNELISMIKTYLNQGSWMCTNDDSSFLPLKNKKQNNLVFTSDSYVVTPIFFPGGDIGKIAFCGTVNDLSVMGAKPLGLSLSLIIEEGFPKRYLLKIISSIGELSEKTGIPVVTGDTKVMEKGSVDKIIINTSGVGLAEFVLNRPIREGDKIIVSGSIGEHGAALLAQRFDLESEITSDSKPLFNEVSSVSTLIRQAKDITRGGLAAVLNEVSQKEKKQLLIFEEDIPIRKEVKALTEILGIDPLLLACEGRLVCFCAAKNAEKVVHNLKKFNSAASIIGEVHSGTGVVLQTLFGRRTLNMPSGQIVPRIC
ncbi:hydrogenase expression/formation protein HypE [Candidatus Woesearchaeota archaeon]|nr:MAG: hydrogenase expression/formation protein HypE [Candidatus Woesearchaeota archaeon]